MAIAYETLNTIQRKDETMFPFLLYLSKLSHCLNVLKKGKQGKSDQEQVQIMMQGIKTSNMENCNCCASCPYETLQ